MSRREIVRRSHRAHVVDRYHQLVAQISDANPGWHWAAVEFAAMEQAEAWGETIETCEYCPADRSVLLLDGQNACRQCRSECVTECSSCGYLVPCLDEFRRHRLIGVFGRVLGDAHLAFRRCACGGEIPLLVDPRGGPCDPQKRYIGLTVRAACAPGWSYSDSEGVAL